MIRRPRIFYGWYIVGLTIISMALIYGIRNSFSVLFGPILDEFGWLRSSTAIMLSLNVLFYGLTAPLAGMLVDRWKPRRVALIGVLILTAATSLCYYADQLWHFYVLFGFAVPVGTAFLGTPILSPALINWFSKRRGLAISLGQIGGGLSFAYSFIVEAVISNWGWRPSFFVMAATVFVVLLPLYLFFYRLRPEEKGLQPYGIEKPSTDAAEVGVQAALGEWTLGKALKTRNLWGLIAAQFFYWGIGNYLIIGHQVKFAVEAGYSSMMATSIFALFGLVSIAGQLAASISDKIGRERTVAIAIVLVMGAMVALLSVKDNSAPWLLYVYASCSGLATGLFSPQVFAAVGDIFHGKNIGAISAMLLTGFGIGGAIGPWLGGYIYDMTGSYTVAFYIVAGSYLMAGISFMIAAPRKSEEIRARLQMEE
ncbi:MAG: MFS transporter [Dehalococcoidales bacterium]|nr:MFS transporter [Dehalococcoidales bacterium]